MTELLLKNLSELESKFYEFEEASSKFTPLYLNSDEKPNVVYSFLPTSIQEFKNMYGNYQKFLNSYIAVCSSAQSEKEKEFLVNHEGLKAVRDLNDLMEILYQRYVCYFEKSSIKCDALDEAMFQKSWEDFAQILSFKRLERELIKGNKGIANYADLIKQYEFLETKVIGQKNGDSVGKKETAMGRMELRKEEVEAKFGKFENQVDILLNSLSRKTDVYGTKDKFASVENHKKDIILDEAFFERLTLVSQMKYLECILKNIEAVGVGFDLEDIVEIQYQGKIRQIPIYYEPIYRKYMAMQKNLSVKFMKNVDKTSKESLEQQQFKEYNDFKNIQGATARADEKLEEEVFQSEESMEDVYEKICQLQSQEVKDAKTEQMLKIYKNKLKRMYKNKKSKKTQELDSFWSHFPALTGKEKISEKASHFWHLLTYEPEEFMQSKEFSDDTKAQAISKVLSFFDSNEQSSSVETESVNEEREALENAQALLTKNSKNTFKIKTSRKPKLKLNLGKKLNKHSIQVMVRSIPTSFQVDKEIYDRKLEFWLAERMQELDGASDELLAQEIQTIDTVLNDIYRLEAISQKEGRTLFDAYNALKTLKDRMILKEKVEVNEYTNELLKITSEEDFQKWAIQEREAISKMNDFDALKNELNKIEYFMRYSKRLCAVCGYNVDLQLVNYRNLIEMQLNYLNDNVEMKR